MSMRKDTIKLPTDLLAFQNFPFALESQLLLL